MSYVGNEPADVVVATPPDGDKGDVVVSGSGTNWTVESAAGNFNLKGVGARILGQMSDNTRANNVLVQSTGASSTRFGLIPPSAGTQTQFELFNSTTPTDSIGQVVFNTSELSIRSAVTPTGTTYLPMTFYTGGAERMRIDTSGNVGVGVIPVYKFDVLTAAGRIGFTNNGATVNRISSVNSSNSATLALDFNAVSYSLKVGSIETLAINASGNVTQNYAAGLGYGTGAGGTVTQATDKTTAVTLNKPTGKITMNNAALAANTGVGFIVYNTLVADADTAIVHVEGGTTSTFQYEVSVKSFAAGQFYIYLRNTTAVSLSEAVVISFAIIKGAIS